MMKASAPLRLCPLCSVVVICVWWCLVQQKCDRSADGRLDHGEIEVFCRELLRRPELDAVFIRYSANGCVLSTVDLREFLKDQGEDASPTHAQSLIVTYELNEWGTLSHLITAISVCCKTAQRERQAHFEFI